MWALGVMLFFLLSGQVRSRGGRRRADGWGLGAALARSRPHSSHGMKGGTAGDESGTRWSSWPAAGMGSRCGKRMAGSRES